MANLLIVLNRYQPQDVRSVKNVLLWSIGSLSLYSIPSRIGLYIYIFHVAAFVLANGFDIFSCLISAPRRPGKFRTTILGQSWRHIKLAEYSTAFPSTAATTHFAAMSPPRDPNAYTEQHIYRGKLRKKEKACRRINGWMRGRSVCVQVAVGSPRGVGSMNGVWPGGPLGGGVGGGRWALLGRVRAEDGWKEENGLQLPPPRYRTTPPKTLTQAPSISFS